MEIKDKIIELSKILDEIDDFGSNISSKDQEYDFKISDLYHKLEDMTLDSKKCYRFCKELKSVLLDRRDYKNNKDLYYMYAKNIQKIINGVDNRKILLSQICTEDKKLKTSQYKNRIYTEEEIQEKIGV